MSAVVPEVAAGLLSIGAEPELVRFVELVSQDHVLTATVEDLNYVGMRPATRGAIATYVNSRFLAVRLAVGRARTESRLWGWQLRAENGTSGIVHVLAAELRDPDTMDRVVALFHEAFRKSLAGPEFRSGDRGPVVAQISAPLCPTHFVEMSGGSCDQCD